MKRRKVISLKVLRPSYKRGVTFEAERISDSVGEAVGKMLNAKVSKLAAGLSREILNELEMELNWRLFEGTWLEVRYPRKSASAMISLKLPTELWPDDENKRPLEWPLTDLLAGHLEELNNWLDDNPTDEEWASQLAGVRRWSKYLRSIADTFDAVAESRTKERPGLDKKPK